ncbi:MAG: DUF4453 domain-containing protein [Pseudomonadota bacterium]
MLRSAALALVLATSAQADEICNDLWFAKNGIYDAAGYCFGSPLGRSLYDNEGCTTSNPELTTADRRKVNQIEQREVDLGCEIDMSVTEFDLPALSFRQDLRVQPVRSQVESACIGWRGPTIEVFAAPSPEVPLGSIEGGDDILFSHEPQDDWYYVTVWSSGFGEVKSAGWIPFLGDAPLCTDAAG